MNSFLDEPIFFLPLGYQQRTKPQYFVDEDSSDVIWQPDVYTEVVSVANFHSKNVIIDLGCGRAGKLLAIGKQYPNLEIIGVDFGTNFNWCLKHASHGKFIEADLETAVSLDVEADFVAGSVIVCSDVLEHLVNPLPVMRLICSLLQQGAARAILSTPARDKRAGIEHLGPPFNPAHVREWACDEFSAFVTSCGLYIEKFALTRSDNRGGGMTTQLLTVRL